jgi:thiol-disulfide isomerase/thioredoxin
MKREPGENWSCGELPHVEGGIAAGNSNTVGGGSGKRVVPGCGIFRRMSLLAVVRRAVFVALILTAFNSFAGLDDREPAPRFHAKTLTGESFSNDSVKGKVVLLQFWATWCRYCRGEQSIVDSLDREFSSKGLVVLAVDVGESKKTVKKYLENNPRSCKIVLTDDTNLAAMYAANSYPIYVVIDRDGNVVDVQRGAGGERPLRNLLRRAGLESPE